MNKKEINEIKKNFNDDSGFFTVHRVITAFVDAEKKIKCRTNRLYSIIPQEESEPIMINLKKVLSGKIGSNLVEYAFTKEAYEEGGTQRFLYGVLKSKLADDETADKFLNAVAEKVEYGSAYTIFAAHCTYSVLRKSRTDDPDGDTYDYNFIITAICPVNLRIDGLVYNDDPSSIARKKSYDRIVGLPTDGFLFPLFNDRSADVNSVMYYTKNAKKPNTTIIEDFLGCEFVMTAKSEKETFNAILSEVCGDELDYDLITIVNDKIRTIIDQNVNETEVTTVDQNALYSILWEAGVSRENLENLPKIYEKLMGDKPFTAVNLADQKTVLTVPSVKVTVDNNAVGRVDIQIIGGRKCIVIKLDDPEISVNGVNVAR